MEPSQAGKAPGRGAPARRPKGKRRIVLAGLIATAAVAGLILTRGRRAEPATGAAGASSRREDAALPRVEVVRPREGGIERMTVQPGSVYAYESVDLQAMVSGYLKVQVVDIGSRVSKGQVLAEIDVPREEMASKEAAAILDQSKAQARQAEAQVRAAEAERETAAATVAQTEADVDRLVANRRLAESQYARVKSLYERNATAERLVDEQQRDMEAAVAAERTSHLAVLTAKARLAGSTAKVELARADVAEARAAVEVAESRLAKTQVDMKYAKIVAPFDGVVTRRRFHPGAFIRSASDGGQEPLLTVARTDLMRVVVRVPDRDVVLAGAGDPAVVTIDGLGGREFRGVVSRVAESEEHETRTMRVEIDLPNPDRLLREGMYGKASIGLEAASRRLTVPVACVLERSGKGHGVVQLVRGGKVERVKVELGADNGTLVEVDSGLKPDDDVVVRSSTPLEPGMAVVAAAPG